MAQIEEYQDLVVDALEVVDFKLSKWWPGFDPTQSCNASAFQFGTRGTSTTTP